MFASIKARIVAFYMAILLLVLSVLGGFLYLSLHRIVYDAIDTSLLSKAKALASIVDTEQGPAPFKFSDDIIWQYNSPEADSYFQIRRTDGSSIQKSVSLGHEQLPWNPGAASPRFRTIILKGRSVRLVTLEMQPDPEPTEETSGPEEPGFVLQCGEDISARLALLHNYRWILLAAILAVLLISAAGGLLIAAKALAPIEEISQTIGGISEANLTERVAVEKFPKELKILAGTFNRTFDSLEKSFSRQKQFIADASHELKTPLSVIVSQSEITLRRPRTAAEYRRPLEVILGTGRMMSDMVKKLVSIACLDATTLEMKMTNLDLRQVMEESVRLLAPIAEQHGIELQLSAPEPATVAGDRQALLEVFVNVLDNAIKYNMPSGRVDVSLGRTDGWLAAVICDSGSGIPAAEQDRVFDRFYRVDKSRSKKIGGSGLGLSIARDIIQLHGGTMQLSSQPGEGTTVTILLREA